MEGWKKILIPKDSSVLDTIRIMDASSFRIGFGIVVDEHEHLIGVITDGDVRRGLLAGVELEDSISSIMSDSPYVAYADEKKSDIIKRLEFYRINHMPIIDKRGKVVGLETNEICFATTGINIPVIIMVGGKGMRLRPLTEDCPKSMLKVGDKPILDLIVRNLISVGFREFWLAVNYMRNDIKNYFGDGSRFGVSINYIEEEKELGTAGALSLYTREVTLSDSPILVMNGDILTDINYDSLLETYHNNSSDAIVCIKEYSYELQYGAVEVDGNRLVKLTEKPKYAFYVNSGIYIFNSNLLSLIPENEFCDMTTFINELLLMDDLLINVFLIREYWLDIGTKEGYGEAIKRMDYV